MTIASFQQFRSNKIAIHLTPKPTNASDATFSFFLLFHVGGFRESKVKTSKNYSVVGPKVRPTIIAVIFVLFPFIFFFSMMMMNRSEESFVETLPPATEKNQRQKSE
jgi:hypothetical protein